MLNEIIQFLPNNILLHLFRVTFHSCYDGDTCRFALPGLHPIIGKNIAVRLNGIDTSEIRGKCQLEIKRAKIAKLRLNKILMIAKKFELRNIRSVQRVLIN